MLKRTQVVMLPTENKSNICIVKLNDEDILVNNKGYNSQHLYIISNDEIKDGDFHIISDHEGYGDKKYKIIATTDKSLNLPQPSQQFIEEYIEEYNKGNIIIDVLVEYEGIISSTTWEHDEPEEWKLKINPKDNTITIKKVKDSWNREEVIQLIKSAWSQANNNNIPRMIHISQDKWIEENL